MPPNTNNQNTGSVNYNQVVTPVSQGSNSQNAGIVGYGAGGNAIYANQPITTQDLQPTQPLKLPTATVPTVPSSLGGAIQASVNTNKTEMQRYLDEQQQIKDTTGKDLKTMMGEIMGTTNEIANAPSSVDRTKQNQAREQIDLYTNQIEQEQIANRRLIENLQKNNPQGTFGGALNDKIQNLERDSLSKQADLAILQNAATRNFTTAKDIADQQVQLKLEPLKAKLDNLKFFYSENKEQFNKADDRLFQNKIKEEERVYQREEKNLQQIADIKFNAVKNGAPLSVINRLAKAKTVDEALAFAGNYNTDPLDRAIKNAQLRKLNTENSSGEDNNKLLSIKEAQDAGVPYGTTFGQLIAQNQGGDALTTVRGADKITQLQQLTKPSVGLATSAGSLRGAPIPFLFKGKINSFRANAKNVLSQLTVDQLGRVKADGVTFGALSNGERLAVGEAASKLNAAMIYSGKGDNKEATGRFKLPEKEVIDAFDTIKKYSELDFLKRNGFTYEQYQADQYLNAIDQSMNGSNAIYQGY